MHKSSHTSVSHADVTDLLITAEDVEHFSVCLPQLCLYSTCSYRATSLHYILSLFHSPLRLLLPLLNLSPRQCQLRHRTGAAGSDMNTSSCTNSWPQPHYICYIQSSLLLRHRSRGGRKQVQSACPRLTPSLVYCPGCV